MSLKVVHIFFIAVSILLAFGFGAWGMYTYFLEADVSYLVMGIISAIIGVVLVVYGINFLHKFKHVRNL